MVLLLPLAVLSAALLAVQAQPQRPFAAAPTPDLLQPAAVASQPFRTLDTDQATLADITGDVFTAVEHPDFPGHRVRIKETTGYCDPSVRSYAGYLDVGHGKNLWFQLFESRSKPDEDDVQLWINGGPGASSAMGLLMELGACRVVDPTRLNGTEPNPHAWNENLNVFFLDQPIGVGGSYAENGQEVARTEQAAVDVQAFLAIFFETFKEFRSRPLHLSGESYGGRYLPIFGAAVVDGNKKLEHPLNLKSVIIGNGVVDRFDLTLKHYDLSCTRVTELAPVLGVTQCAAMQAVLPRCRAMMKANCEDVLDALGCQNAIDFCYEHLKYPYYATGGNPFDMSKKCDGKDGCYETIEANIAAYLNLPAVREHLGVDKDAPPFEGSSSRVAELFSNAMDHTGRTSYYVSSLLHHGVKVLIYAGKFDYQCGWPHQLSWTRNLEWTGQAGFNGLALEPWFLDANATAAKARGDEPVGETKSFGGLTLVSVRGAGHMVPFDKPAEALEMLQRWHAHGHL